MNHSKGARVAKREILVCDVCGRDDDVLTVHISMDSEEVVVDLCPEHRQPVVNLISQGSAVRVAKVGRRGPNSIPVVPKGQWPPKA